MKNKGIKRFATQEIMEAQRKYACMNDNELCKMIWQETLIRGRPPKVNEIPASKYIKKRLSVWNRVFEKVRVKKRSVTCLRCIE